MHLAASAISTTLISALPELSTSFTPSCKLVFDVVSGGYCKTKTVKPTVVGYRCLTGMHPCSLMYLSVNLHLLVDSAALQRGGIQTLFNSVVVL